MCPTINWDEGKPAGADSLGIGDDQIRSDKSAIRVAIDAEHIFPSAGGDAGVHRLGSARPYITTQSLISSSGTDGRVAWTSDTSRYFHVGSGGTSFIGGATVISAGSYPGTTPQRAYWALEFGVDRTNISGAKTVSLPNSGYSGTPYVQVSILDATGTGKYVNTITVTSAGFAVQSYNAGGTSASSQSFFWQSIGTRTL